MPVPRESFDDEPEPDAPAPATADDRDDGEGEGADQRRPTGPVAPGEVPDLRSRRRPPALGPVAPPDDGGGDGGGSSGSGRAGKGEPPGGRGGGGAADAAPRPARKRPDGPKVRLGCDAPAQVVTAVADEVTRRQRAGGGDRTELALQMMAALPTSIDEIDRLLELVAAARRWIEEPRSRRLEYRVPPLVRQHVENLVSWAERARGVELDKTDVVLAMTVNLVDPESPPLEEGQADQVEQLLAQYR